MTASFTPDTKVAKIADAYSQDAVDLAAKGFQVPLDFSDKSVAAVETMLAELHQSLPAAKPPEEAIWNFAKGFGSYVGEVLRKNHGAEWGTITDGTNSFPGLRMKDGALVWPWGRAHQRLVKGAENNVWHYFQTLISGA